MVVVYFGAFTPQRARQYADEAIDPENDISISVSEDDFFRTDISENCDNYPMLWKLPCMRAFQSVVPVSIMDFYEHRRHTGRCLPSGSLLLRPAWTVLRQVLL